MPAHRPTRCLVLGGGFAGAFCARELARRAGDQAEVLLVDRRNHLLFSPLLVEAGTGSLEPRHTVVALRSLIGNARFLLARALSAEPRAGQLTVQVPGEGPRELEFDHLVVCPGSATKLPPVAGLREHGFQMKSLHDAVALRDRAIECLERAHATDEPRRRRTILHWVVVGGSFTGVEVAGEFHELMQRASRAFPKIDSDECRMTLVERGQRLLPALDADLARFATRHLGSRGIRVVLEQSLSAIGPRSARLDDGDEIETETVVWTAGIQPAPVVKRLGLPTDDGGWILCEPDLRVRGFDNVWALGDCAVNPDPRGEPYPPTAQHAVRQGVHAARNLHAVIRGEAPVPFRYRSAGALAPLGCRTAVARIFGLRLAGFPAWFLWRTVYLLKMPTWRRRLRVALDWTLDLVAGREDVQLGLTRVQADESDSEPT